MLSSISAMDDSAAFECIEQSYRYDSLGQCLSAVALAKEGMSADPIGFPDGPNQHFYAPVPRVGVDPLGLKAVIDGTEMLGSRVVDQTVTISWEINTYGGGTAGTFVDSFEFRFESTGGTYYETPSEGMSYYSGPVEYSGTLYNSNSSPLFVDPNSTGTLIPITETTLIEEIMSFATEFAINEVVFGGGLMTSLLPPEGFWDALQNMFNRIPSDPKDWEWVDVVFEN